MQEVRHRSGQTGSVIREPTQATQADEDTTGIAVGVKNHNHRAGGFLIQESAVIYGEITAFGTPGETRTHYLALRRYRSKYR